MLRTKNEATVSELSEAGCAQVITGVDVTNLDAVTRMAGEVEGGPLDVVINNAGYFTSHHETVDDMDFGEEMLQIDVCALGPLRISTELRKAEACSVAQKLSLISSQAEKLCRVAKGSKCG